MPNRRSSRRITGLSGHTADSWRGHDTADVTMRAWTAGLWNTDSLRSHRIKCVFDTPAPAAASSCPSLPARRPWSSPARRPRSLCSQTPVDASCRPDSAQRTELRHCAAIWRGGHAHHSGGGVANSARFLCPERCLLGVSFVKEISSLKWCYFVVTSKVRRGHCWSLFGATF